MTTVLNGKSTPLRNPNAAPLLSTCVKSMNPGMIVRLSCSPSEARIIAFVAWSTATITIGSQTSRWRRGGTAASRSPAETLSSSVLSIDRLGQCVLASVTQAGPGRIGRDRADVAPAPFTFDAASTLDRYTRPRFGMCLDIVGRRPQLHLRDDEQHRQLFRVRFELRQLCGGRRHDHLGLERAADLLVLPKRLDLRKHLVAKADQHLPPADELAVDERI